MNNKRVLIIVLIVAIIVDLALVGGFLALKTSRQLLWGKPATVYSTAAVLQQVQTVSELVTVKYVIEKVVILEDVKWIAGWGENRVLLLAHGNVKAGIDLSKLEPGDIEIRGKSITVRLPPAQITDAYLDERQTRVIERTTGLLRTFDKDLEQNARIQALDDIRRAARNNNILKEADTRARAQLRNLFLQLGFESVEFQGR